MAGDLYYGDNLDVLRHKIRAESVDLIYLDPPFNSNRTYNLIHKDSQAQQRAFFDTWNWDDAAERAYAELVGAAPCPARIPEALSSMMKALKAFLWDDGRNALAYLSMMAIRLVEMRKLLRASGSLYLHCDPTASHYLKMILDTIFGAQNFRSEIIWKRTTAHNSAKRYGPVHDVILYYARDSSKVVWNQQYQPYDEKYIATKYRYIDPETGQRYRLSDMTGAGTRKGDSGKPWRGFNPTAIGRHWQPPSYCYNKYAEITGTDLARFPLIKRLDELDRIGLVQWPKKAGGRPEHRRFLHDMQGVALQDIWTDIDVLNARADERLGFATQKPTELLERIIAASSNEGDLVLDPFCGCGSTIEAAEDMGRKWIGIDIAIRAIDVIKDRLDARFQQRVWTEYGEPSDVDSAAHLADTNPYDFQWWAVRKIGGQPPKGEKKRGRDGGIDGEMLLKDFESGTQRRVIVSVKGGRGLNPDMVKALKSTVELEKADYGILITMHPPTKGMRDVARDFGTVAGSGQNGKLEHRIRIISVPEMFSGAVRLPGINVTPRTRSTPPPVEARVGETLMLPFPAQASTRALVKARPRGSANELRKIKAQNDVEEPGSERLKKKRKATKVGGRSR